MYEMVTAQVWCCWRIGFKSKELISATQSYCSYVCRTAYEKGGLRSCLAVVNSWINKNTYLLVAIRDTSGLCAFISTRSHAIASESSSSASWRLFNSGFTCITKDIHIDQFLTSRILERDCQKLIVYLFLRRSVPSSSQRGLI